MADYTQFGDLTDIDIGGTAGICPAWALLDSKKLLIGGATRSGARTVARRHGVTVGRLRWDRTTHDLTWWLFGEHDPAGDPHADVTAGLQSNLFALRAAVLDPPDVPGSTRTWSVTARTGDVLTGEARILDWDVVSAGYDTWELSVRVELPYGPLA